MPTTPNQPSPDLVLELIEVFRRSKTMFAAVSLGVFDALEDGPKTAAALAGALKLNEEALKRLLDACTGLGLLDRDDAAYRNAPTASAYLCQHSPTRLTGYINYSNELAWKLWGDLEGAVREGTHRWTSVFGGDGALFSFFEDETNRREFLMGMHGHGLISSPRVVSAFDLGRFRKLVDLGGATGHLAVAACQRYPELRAVVLDRPDVVPIAQELIAATPVADRVDVVAGDFFEDELPEADLYSLGRIVHDWSAPKVDALLKRIADRLPSGGGLLLAEKLLDDDRRGPGWAQMQDLNMLVGTEGQERTFAEYEALVKRAGFARASAARTGAPVDAVLAIKA